MSAPYGAFFFYTLFYMPQKFTNELIHESSPYLLQHAHNPVEWVAWNDDTLKRAQQENKPLLISIGYAACHWCHVMEHECFEDVEVAKVMNEHFVNIKIDREERPDVDHIYMDALQMMTGSGGWPLNIVALPDGRPFWGATYVQKENWKKVLLQLSDLHKKEPQQVLDYARKMEEGIQAINLVELNQNSNLINLNELENAVQTWSQYFDYERGGYNRAPKFMMPVNLNFLLHYAVKRKNQKVFDYVNTSLTQMAWGGIFDHVGGGFSRYSVDAKWHVPHFEKMLYDNGQLVSLYAQAYAQTGKKLYKETVEKTIDFVKTELMHVEGGFYSSLDADSLNDNNRLEEGAFYVWKEENLRILLKENFEIFASYFNVNDYGYWEHGNYVLIRNTDTSEIVKLFKKPEAEIEQIITESLEILKTERTKRQRPRLDDKILTSWNGLMLKGLVDAHRYLEKKDYLTLAKKNAQFIETNLAKKDGGLYHNHKNGKSTINGYLEDYASIIEAYLGLYEITFEEKWLLRSKELADYVLDNFMDDKSGMLFFTSAKDRFVIRRTVETNDNVIPASNSIMAKNFFKLSRFFSQDNYEKIALQQLKNIQENLEKNAQNHANWMELALYFNLPFFECAIVGPEVELKAKEVRQSYLPNTIFAGTPKHSSLSILQNRFAKDTTSYYVCEKGACKLPVTLSNEVLTQLN
ncbi:thioredoxin domain-containing protein [Euzebyella saccharophila]|uniref:Thioredoxin domain-containing protein n=1 Tax=Euzebyella saccharophila TaxID=679664 RepID=A0ABV8K0G4_9FLAO|nr:thioredoxin domain-containing protein [Euzebyella saccharophila]